MEYKIADLKGSPALYVDGKPVFYGLMWGSAPSPESYSLKECARLYGLAGVHFFTFDIGTGGSPPEWIGPHPGSDSHYDFSTLAQRFQHVIDADPEAKFHLRIHLEMPEWWQKLYPEECELLSDGRRMCQSYASSLWREQAKNFLTALIDHLRKVGLFERVAAYQAGTGSTGEWVKGPGSMGLTCGDFSQPMQKYFRQWLKEKYQNDEIKLRNSWSDHSATFETAQVPPAALQFKTRSYTFRDPTKEQQVIDYYRALADLSASLLIDFCETIKKETGGKALAGAFYGYLTELAWNAGFFGEGLDSEYSTYQRSGHLGLWKALQSPAVDFMVSPYSYGFRGVGGHGPAMPPSESLRIHQKLYLFEEDSRTHLTHHDHPNFGKTDTLEDSLAVLKRNLAYVVTSAQGIWWLAGSSPRMPHIELSQQPAFRTLIQRFQNIGTFALNLDRNPSAEIAVLLDHESFFYESLHNTLDLPLIFQQRLWGLPRLGAPHDMYLMQDFLDGNIKPYKLYIFLNPFFLDQKRRTALKKQIQQENRTALWIYAPGYIDEQASMTNMTDITGISFGNNEHPWGPMMYLTNLQHPITRDCPQDLTWGTNSYLGPVFHVNDDSAVTLGNVVYSQGRCRSGFVVKEFPTWRSIYSAAPNLPAPILRGICRYAGVHLYSEQGDVLYATPQLLAVHSQAGGKRVYKLPHPVEVVHELFDDQIVAENTDTIEVNLSPSSTLLFFTGDRETIAGFNPVD